MNSCAGRNQRGSGRGWQFSRQELMLNNRMRMLWEQHVFWTRLVISGIVFDSPDSDESQKRLPQNPGDFAEALCSFYGQKAADQFAALFTAHLTIAAQLVAALKNGKKEEADRLTKQWYENADQIADFLAVLNPFWSARRWREMLDSHLDLTQKEAGAFLTGNFAESVTVFDQIEREALEMADQMTTGIVLQFSNLF